MIELIPVGGLCNRMRAIDSALALARARKEDLHIYWQATPLLNCRFGDLFLPIEGAVTTGAMPPLSRLALRFGHFHQLMSGIGAMTNRRFYHHDEHERLVRDAEAGRLTQHGRLHITSFGDFHPTDRRYPDFRPIPAVMDLVEDISAGFDAWTIGVHIRRTDNVRALEVSPTHLFVEAMEKAVAGEPRTRFYLATDSMDTRQELMERFGDRLLSSAEPADRSTMAGMRHALVELYVLSRTAYLFRSYFSSYSRTAAQIGGIGSRVIGDPGQVPAP